MKRELLFIMIPTLPPPPPRTYHYQLRLCSGASRITQRVWIFSVGGSAHHPTAPPAAHYVRAFHFHQQSAPGGETQTIPWTSKNR
jgi:hypothetical protein